MAKFKMSEVIDSDAWVSCKFASGITDKDIGKPVGLSAADTYDLCADGDLIEGFITGINPATQGGLPFGTVQTGGYKRVELDGAVSIGAAVAAADPEAAGTPEANGLGKVSTHTVLATDMFSWRLVSGTGLTGDLTAIIEKC